MDLLVFESGARQTSVRISVPVQDFLRHLILKVVLDDFEVEFAPNELHVDSELLVEDLLLEVHPHGFCQLICIGIVVAA